MIAIRHHPSRKVNIIKVSCSPSSLADLVWPRTSKSKAREKKPSEDKNRLSNRKLRSFNLRITVTYDGIKRVSTSLLDAAFKQILLK